MIKLSKEEMLDILEEGDPSVIFRDRIVGISRWSNHHELVFQHRGKLYIAYYHRGATEYQDELPWEYDDEVACHEAEAFQTTDYRITKNVS